MRLREALGHSRGDRRRVQSTTGCPSGRSQAGEQRVTARDRIGSPGRSRRGASSSVGIGRPCPRPARLPLAPPGPAQRLVLRRGFLVFLTEDRGGALRAQVLRHVVLRGDLLAGLVQLPDRLRGRPARGPGGDHAPGAVVAAVGVPGDLLQLDPVLVSRASTTSARVCAPVRVLSRVRRACWATIARSCSTGPAYRSTRSTGTPAIRATSSADSPARMRAWMSRGASEA